MRVRIAKKQHGGDGKREVDTYDTDDTEDDGEQNDQTDDEAVVDELGGERVERSGFRRRSIRIKRNFRSRHREELTFLRNGQYCFICQ